ncbi:hypothetical protein NC651_018298 [Populus alba x Populus x berolinensis]|nr:hypothetical protein NC651_018298 [Populus alba x Populus x berolinensis]
MNSQLPRHKFIATVSPTTHRRSTTIDPERQGKKQLSGTNRWVLNLPFNI